jgi:hypothetical protein
VPALNEAFTIGRVEPQTHSRRLEWSFLNSSAVRMLVSTLADQVDRSGVYVLTERNERSLKRKISSRFPRSAPVAIGIGNADA